MPSELHAILLAGGQGTRLWPHSRAAYPKQFLDLLGEGRSLLQASYQRVLRSVPNENIWVVTQGKHKRRLLAQLPTLLPANVLCEPQAKNTAPCLAYACYRIHAAFPQAKVLVVPTDHCIRGDAAFDRAVQIAWKAATEEHLVVFGIPPRMPHTGYGYLQCTRRGVGGGATQRVLSFTEKPSAREAKCLLAAGDSLWNAGIFVWRVSTIIRAFEKHMPSLAEVFHEGRSHYYTPSEPAFIRRGYAKLAAISIDYAILEEQHEAIRVVPCTFEWFDLGDWEALYEIKEKDASRNVVLGAPLFSRGSRQNLVAVEKKKLVVLEGLVGYSVLDFDNVLVICRRKSTSDFRKLVQEAKKKLKEKPA